MSRENIPQAPEAETVEQHQEKIEKLIKEEEQKMHTNNAICILLCAAAFYLACQVPGSSNYACALWSASTVSVVAFARHYSAEGKKAKENWSKARTSLTNIPNLPEATIAVQTPTNETTHVQAVPIGGSITLTHRARVIQDNSLSNSRA